MNAPAFIARAVRKIDRAVSYDAPRTLIAGTVKPWISFRPRAMYRSWIEEGRTPACCPTSQISQRAYSRATGSPKTAVRTSSSILAVASASGRETVTRPSFTETASPNRVFRLSMSCMASSQKCSRPHGRRGSAWRESSSPRAAGVARPRARDSDHPRRIRFGQQIPLLARRLGVRAAEHGVGELLAELHPGLVEGVHAVQLPGVRGRQLEQHQQLADGECVQTFHQEGHVRPAAPRQRARGRPPLDVQQLTEAMPAKIGELRDVGMQLRDLDVGRTLLHADERDRLVGRTLHE